ncbi:MAG: flippase-like domain-containing protein [Clostridia bacterium]|nr:flippase-like domain-containing protein [Clostridia bacterium]
MKSWKKWLSYLLFLAMIALLGWYLYANREDLARLITLDFATVAWMMVLALGACTLNCVYHKLILDTHKIPLDVVDWMGVVYVANAMAYVLPLRMDLVFSATYYKRTKNLAYVKSASMAAGNIVFSILFALIQMFAALLCTGLIQGVWPGALWLVWLAAAAGTAAFLVMALWFRDRMPAFLSRIKIVRNIVDGFCDLLTDRNLLWRLLLCLIVNNILHLLLYIACFRGIGMEVTLYQALFYNSVSRIMSLVAIVPGNIGIQQAVMGAAGSLMGDVFQHGVMVSLLQSAALMVVYILAGAAFSWPVWKRWRGRG